MEKRRTIIETKGTEGEDLKLAVLMPGHKVQQESQMVYNFKVAELLRTGISTGQRLLLKSELEAHMREIGLWTDKDQSDYNILAQELAAMELAIRKGGCKLGEARAKAIRMITIRGQLVALMSKRNQLDSATVETQAENHKFNWLVSKCVVYADTGQPFFKNLDDYMARAGEQASIDCAKELARMYYGYNVNWHDTLFEVRFLKKYGLMDSQGRYTTRDGKLVNAAGELVNELGQRIDAEGKPIAALNAELSDEPEAESPFLDDDNQPVKPVEPEGEAEKSEEAPAA